MYSWKEFGIAEEQFGHEECALWSEEIRNQNID